MNETIRIRRYRLTYSGADESNLRRWALRPVQDRRGLDLRPERPAQPSSAMYAVPLRT
jgi:hypothetical protein